MCALRRRSQRKPLLGRSSTTERNHVCSTAAEPEEAAAGAVVDH